MLDYLTLPRIEKRSAVQLARPVCCMRHAQLRRKGKDVIEVIEV